MSQPTLLDPIPKALRLAAMLDETDTGPCLQPDPAELKNSAHDWRIRRSGNDGGVDPTTPRKHGLQLLSADRG